jgi:hypothetical protein
MSIYTMSTNIIIQLLLQIHKYYPIGISTLNTDYPGYKLMQDKISMKIDQIINHDKTDWSEFINDCNAIFPAKRILDAGYYQFPSYFCQIELENKTYEEFQFKKFINISVSILCDTYTVFLEDRYESIKYSPSQNSNNTIRKKVFYLNSSKDSNDLEEVNKVIKTITSRFPKFNYISYYGLLSTKITGGLPYGKAIDDSNKYSIYEFLFDANLEINSADILE